MSSYCWGDLSIPRRIIDETDTHVIVEIGGDPKQIPHSAIKGRIESGQRVRVLTSGGGWKPGTALDGDRLVVRFDAGGEWEMHDVRWMIAVDNKPPVIIDSTAESITTEPVPMPVLDDALDGELTRAMEFLEPLEEGDRVRIVLAGPPLEHLTGAVGTVEAINSLGFVSVVVDGHGAKLFKREQLDFLEEENQPVSVVPAPLDNPETLENSLQPIALDARVKCLPGPKGDRWANKIGIVREIRGDVAWLWFCDGVPLYPCGVERLTVIE